MRAPVFKETGFSGLFAACGFGILGIMFDIVFRRFESLSALDTAVAALLRHHFEREYPCHHAVMLAGGKTPFGAYRIVAGSKCVVSRGLRVFVSDERLVPITSPESNCGNMRFMFEALGLAESQIIGVSPDLQPELAAERYDRALRAFFNGGGIIPLGLLGLGADGHTASLFSREDLARGRGRYAIASAGPGGVRRVSVSVDMLARIQQVIFVAAGQDKEAIAGKLRNCPAKVTAGLAAAGIKMKQLWFAA